MKARVDRRFLCRLACLNITFIMVKLMMREAERTTSSTDGIRYENQIEEGRKAERALVLRLWSNSDHPLA
jgi:hypothetical protein